MKCKTCKSNCIWRGGSDKPEDMKCLVGYKPITNGDQVRKMTDEELVNAYIYIFNHLQNYTDSWTWLKNWMKQDAVDIPFNTKEI